MRRTILSLFLFTLICLFGGAANCATAQTTLPLIVQVRTASGRPVVGAVVKLLWGERSHAAATTDSSGLAHFSAVGSANLYLRLLPGTSGVGMVNEEAQRYSQPPLRFQVPPSGELHVFVADDGWIYPDASGTGAPATPVMHGQTAPVAIPYTQDQYRAAHSLPTQSAAQAHATQTAWAEAMPKPAVVATGIAAPAATMIPQATAVTAAQIAHLPTAGQPAESGIAAASAQPSPAPTAHDDGWALYLCLLGLALVAGIAALLWWEAAEGRCPRAEEIR